jgi:hypothetical protein
MATVRMMSGATSIRGQAGSRGNLLPKAAVHPGLAPAEPIRCEENGQSDATRDRHYTGNIDASTIASTALVGAHAFTSRAIRLSADFSRPIIPLPPGA